MSNNLNQIISNLSELRPTSIFAVGIITSIKSDPEGCIKMIKDQVELGNTEQVVAVIGKELLTQIEMI